MPNQPSDLKSFIKAVSNKDFLVLDTETTGLGPDDEICELAIITANGEMMFDELIKPNKLISQAASDVHGITQAMVENSRSWLAYHDHVKDILQGNIVVTYNATFDRKLLHQTDRVNGIPETLYAEQSFWFCAMTAFAERHGDWNDYRANFKWVTLRNAIAYAGIQPSGEFHGALSDARMTLDLIRWMVEDIREIDAELGHPTNESQFKVAIGRDPSWMRK
jgi:DNA polymerase III subunit epsilon